jgi:hypothetical protein
MSLESERLQENIVKTAKLESNIDHLSDRVAKLCIQIDNSLPLLEKINLRMEDDILRRATSDKLLTRLSDDFTHLSFSIGLHDKKISEHDMIISDLNKLASEHKTILRTSRWWWKGIVSFGLAIISAWGYMENKKDERHYATMVTIQEIEEKKRKIDYNREKYLIRNGKWKNGE